MLFYSVNLQQAPARTGFGRRPRPPLVSGRPLRVAALSAALSALLFAAGCTAASVKVAQSSAQPGTQPGAQPGTQPGAQPGTGGTPPASTGGAQSGGNLKRIPESFASRPMQGPTELTGDLLYEFLVAEVALQRGQTQLAAQAYLDLAKKTHDARAARRATEVSWFAHRPQLATEAARIWNEAQPDSEEAKLWQLQIQVSTNHLDEAAPGLERMLARNPGEQIFLQLGRLLADVTDKAAALKLMRHLAEPYGSMAAAHVAVAQVAAAAGEDEAALTEARAAEKLKPAWEVPVILESTILQRKAPSEAAARLKRFVDENPKSTEVRMAYARTLANEKEYVEARKQFELLVDADPDNVNIVYPVALLSMQLEDYAQAEKYLRRMLELDFNDQNLLDLYLGQVIEEQKRYGEAKEWYEKVGPGEQYLSAQIRLAAVTAKEGDLEAARKRLHEVQPDNNQQRVQLLLAETQLLRDANRTQEAFDTAQHALDKLPNHPDLLYDYAMLAERLDRLDIMETNLRKVMSLKPDQAQ